MYFGGSFEIPTLESNKPNFKWGVFAIPAPQGYLSYVNYHIDTAIALNADSPHPAEALIFLKWLTTPEFAKLLGDQLPGLFPLNLKAPPLADSHGNDFLALNAIDNGRTDIRWPLPNGGLPDGRTLMQDAALGVMQGNLTPQQAADHLQNGLAQWYLPAQQCLH
jgi:raffinose/stachyose/melibiose transport system substrate-binding protein